MARKNVPGYLLHKPSGQAIVVLNGKTIYLGKYKSKASREEYDRVIADYFANGKKLPPTRGTGAGISIEELMIQFLEHAEGYYVKNGKQTDTFTHCRLAVAPVVRYYGKKSVSEFGPTSLVFIREQWVKTGIARQTINSRVNLIRQAFRWGVAREIVPADILHALQAVDHLKAGRTNAREYKEVEPISDEILEKTIPHLPPVVADMVRVQRLCGMRPQDIRNMRSCDINRTGDVWKYTPFEHKTQHHGKTRVLPIGPRAQTILTPYLSKKADVPEAFLFSPQDTMRLQKIEKRQNRKTKVPPSQLNRSKTNPKRQAREQYDKHSYARAIARACKKAGVEAWKPNQLRHSAGTEVRDKYGLEYAQAVLGHANAKTTEIYAKVNFEKAAAVAREIG